MTAETFAKRACVVLLFLALVVLGNLLLFW